LYYFEKRKHTNQQKYNGTRKERGTVFDDDGFKKESIMYTRSGTETEQKGGERNNSRGLNGERSQRDVGYG